MSSMARNLILLASCTLCLGKVISVADLHGDYDRAVNILASAKLIDKVRV